MEGIDFVIALAGNPNTGKSTVFNALTGLHQHTGNWPGKTVTRAEGAYSLGEKNYKVVDLPGTYSLLSASLDEEIARDFILFGKPDVTVIVVDATRLERNLNLVLQILDINRAFRSGPEGERDTGKDDRDEDSLHGVALRRMVCGFDPPVLSFERQPILWVYPHVGARPKRGPRSSGEPGPGAAGRAGKREGVTVSEP